MSAPLLYYATKLFCEKKEAYPFTLDSFIRYKINACL